MTDTANSSEEKTANDYLVKSMATVNKGTTALLRAGIKPMQFQMMADDRDILAAVVEQINRLVPTEKGYPKLELPEHPNLDGVELLIDSILGWGKEAAASITNYFVVRDRVERLLSRLDNRERTIIIHAYDLDGNGRRALKEIGLTVGGVSVSRVTDLRRRATSKMARELKALMLERQSQIIKKLGLDVLDLSERTVNILAEHQVTSLEVLFTLGPFDLLEMTKLDEESIVSEVEQKLRNRCLQLQGMRPNP